MSESVIRYSECFKQKVVQEVESGKWRSIRAARRAYGIRGSQTVQGWLRQYGHPECYPRKVVVMNPDEQDELQRLRQENARLRQELVDAQLDSILERAHFQVLCEQQGIDDPQALKKRIASQLSMPERASRLTKDQPPS